MECRCTSLIPQFCLLVVATSCYQAGDAMITYPPTGGPAVVQSTPTFGTGGTFSLDACTGSTVLDRDSLITLQGGSTWTAGKVGCAVALDGKTGAVDLNGPVINPSASFSISAWIARADSAADGSVVSQDGSETSAFSLRYLGTTSGSHGKLAWVLYTSDSLSVAPVVLQSATDLPLQTWTHVAATYDATAHKAYLYINGALQGETAVSAVFSASGHTVLGRELLQGKSTMSWAGRIDEVQIVQRALSGAEVLALYQQAPDITPLRPPAIPLVIRDPYVSTWLSSSQAPGQWPVFWNAIIKAITIAVRVDGQAYLMMGAPALSLGFQPGTQQQVEVTPTQSKMTFVTPQVALYVTFGGNYDPNDLQRLSAPLGFITMQTQSLDGNTHDVQIYSDVSAEWSDGNTGALVGWQAQDITSNTATVTAFSVVASSPNVLTEEAQYPDWGTQIFASGGANMTFQSGQDIAVRHQFASTGVLSNTLDDNQPRAISNAWPVFAFAYALPNTTAALSPLETFVLGNVRQPAASYLGASVPALWQSYWADWSQMVASVFDDAATGTTQSRAESIDAQINGAAVAAGGAPYAALCAVSLRQVLGGLQLLNTPGDPWMFLKEISSSGEVSTVDVIYPSSPALIYLQPNLLRYLLVPILNYSESGLWPQPFAVHDLGSYPNASGHNDGGGENMPVEESANMVLMVAEYAKMANNAEATGFVQQHYAVLSQWANYLVGNALNPNLQNQTDDFTGPIANSSNLALKGIVAIGAMAQLSALVGNAADADTYSKTAQDYITQWQQMSEDPGGHHLMLAYGMPNSWSLKYNTLPDRILGLRLVPAAVLNTEAAWYRAQLNTFGVPLDNRHSYTKADWQMWTAGALDNPNDRAMFINSLYAFVNTTPQRVPFSDWYDTEVGTQSGFQARPVVGGVFSILARQAAGNLPP